MPSNAIFGIDFSASMTCHHHTAIVFKALFLLVVTTICTSCDQNVREITVSASDPDTDFASSVYPTPDVAQYPNFASAIQLIQVNGHNITFNKNGTTVISYMLVLELYEHYSSNSRVLPPLRVRVHFLDGLNPSVLPSSIGHLGMRHNSAQHEILTIQLTEHPPSKLSTAIDMNKTFLLYSHILTPGIHKIQLRLESPMVMTPLLLTLGEFLFTPNATSNKLSTRKPRFYWSDLWSGDLWTKYLVRCEMDMDFVELLNTRILAAEVLTTAFSVGYASAVQWLGPMGFTPWQQRCYRLSCVASLVFQILFLTWYIEGITTRIAFPLAMIMGLIYFTAFNATNLLILTERSEPIAEPEEIRAMPLLDSRITTRVVMIGYKKARFH